MIANHVTASPITTLALSTTDAPAAAQGVNETSKQSKKLRDGAEQFESMMLEQMLKPLHFGAGTGDDNEEVSGAAGSVQDFGTQAVARAISAHGGFGLARQIIRQVTAEQQSTNHTAQGTKD